MDSHDIFQRYRSERRKESYAGYRLELLPHLSRYVAEIPGAQGMVVFAQLDAENPARAIDEQITYFQEIGQNFEWKVYDFDSPSTLKHLLAQRGFEPDDNEAFLVLSAADWKSIGKEIPGLRIEKLTERHRLRDFVAAEQEIGSEDFSWHLEKYARDLETNSNGISIYCAYVDDIPVGTGRISFPAGSSFAELNSGGVVSRMRGRGIFSALLSRRIEEAKARGYEWLAVDAAPMSRPILLKKGFQHVCWTYPMLRPKGK